MPKIMQDLPLPGQTAPALFKVLEHVEAGTRRRQQHRIAGLGQFGTLLHGVLEGLDPYQRYVITQRFGQALGITAKQYHGPAEALDGLAQRSEFSTFAVATGDQHQLAFDIGTQAFDGGQGSTDVGGLGVVVPVHAITLAHPLAPVGQATELTQGFEHGLERQASGMPQGQCRQGVGLVVGTTHLQLARRHQRLKLERQVLFTLHFTQAKGLEVGLVEAEGPARAAFHRQWPAQGVLAVDNHLAGTAENPVLGQVVGRQAAVAVHMVFADVQHSGHFCVELVGGLQLETGQLQHVQLDVISQQVQRRGTEVAAHRHALAGLGGHFADQGGNGALGVGATDGNDRRLGVPGEQLDVTGQLHATRGCLLQGRGCQGEARAHVQLVGAAQEVHVQLATAHFHLRVITAQGVQFRRLLAGVGDRKGNAPVRQEANQGHAALAEADNDAELVGSDQRHAHLPQFQGCKANQHQNHGDDPEADDHPRLWPALEFKVVVDRRHAEHALAGQLEGGDLDHHRQGFHHEDAAHDEQHDFLADDHGDGAQRSAQCQRADVTHEDLCRVGVEPQEAQAGTDQRAAEHDQLARARYVRDQQVFGELHVTRQVTEDAQGAADHHRRHDCQAVEAIGKVDCVAGADNDEVGQYDEADAQRMVTSLMNGRISVVSTLVGAVL